jgi:hypothetical protein
LASELRHNIDVEHPVSRVTANTMPEIKTQQFQWLANKKNTSVKTLANIRFFKEQLSCNRREPHQGRFNGRANLLCDFMVNL